MKRMHWGSAVVLLAGAIACGTMVDRNGVTDAQMLGSSGGSLQSTKGLEIHVPAGALANDTELTVQAGKGLPEAVTAVEIGPSGTQFATPVTLAFTYPANTPNPERLKVMTVQNGRWVPLPGHSFDPVTRTVSGKTTHLSPYGLVASTETCNNGVDDDADGLIDCKDPACIDDTACPRASCTTNAQCTATEFCLQNQCSPTGFCNVNADCAPNFFCLNQTCSAPGACTSNAQCGVGESCSQGKCTTLQTQDAGSPCDSLVCPPNSVCLNGACLPVPVLDAGVPTFDGGFGPPPPPHCINDGQCPVGFACNKGLQQCEQCGSTLCAGPSPGPFPCTCEQACGARKFTVRCDMGQCTCFVDNTATKSFPSNSCPGASAARTACGWP